MRRILSKALLTVLISICLSASANAQWSNLGEVGADYDLPGAATFDGKLWIFFRRAIDGQIGYLTSSNIDGGAFSGVTVLPTGSIGPRPAAVAFNGRLYLFYAERSSPSRLFFRSIGTTGTWSTEQLVPGASTNDRPGLAVYNGLLYIVWEPAGSADNRIKFCSMTTFESFSGVQTPFGKTTRGPAAAAFNNRLYVIYTGEHGPPWSLYYTSMDSAGVWSSHQQVGGSPMSWERISAGPFRGQLQLYYTGASTYRLLTKYLDTNGSWSPEGWLLQLSAYYGTTAADFVIRQWVFTKGNGGQIWYTVLR